MPQSTARTLSSDMHDAPADHVDALRGAELVTADGRSLPLVGARLLAEAEGGLARIVLEQTSRTTTRRPSASPTGCRYPPTAR